GAALQEFRHGPLDEIQALTGCFLNEFRQRFADDVLVRSSNKIGKTAIDGANFTVQSQGDQHVVKGIDEIAITLLGTGDPVKQLVEVLFTGRFRVALLDALNQTAQLGDFL